MAHRLMPLVILAVLLAPAVALNAQQRSPGTARPEESDHMRQGTAHFERAFYQLIPHKRQHEADAEFDLAAAAFQRELDVRPLSVDAHRRLARLNAVRGRFALAASGYDEVTRLDPPNLDAYVLAALAYIELEQFDTARDRLLDARSRALEPHAQQMLDLYLSRLAARSPQK